MGEKQEKVWVVMRCEFDFPESTYEMRLGPAIPVKVFDDRKDARKYVSLQNKRSRKYLYDLTGVKKG